MCGICGFNWRHDAGQYEAQSEHVINAMMQAMEHRGPDGSGTVRHANGILGHLRLSIIDIETGQQPLSTPDKDVCIVYNGETYNYPELARDLKQQGWAFQTRSDTETLLAGYTLNGADFDSALNGMYAYAILDKRAQTPRLQMGIDPVGIKPVYIAELGDVMFFASEMRAIIAGFHALGKTPQLNDAAALNYLHLGWTPPPQTLLRDVRKMLPGERISIDLRTLDTTSLPPRRIETSGAHDLKETLRASVQRQLIADAPVGFFLSGGVDSSLLVGIAHELGVNPQTFTARFVGNTKDVEHANEADVATAVAEHFGTRHSEVAITEQTLLDSIDEALDAMDQPICDPACLPLLHLSKFARQSVKVCLTGDGGDELFAGYPRHRLAQMRARWRKTPGIGRQAAGAFATLLPRRPTQGLAEKLRRARVGIELLNSDEYFTGPFSGVHSRWLDNSAKPDAGFDVVGETALDLMQADMAGQLVGQMLPKTDHISMYASLECRVPLLDNEMVALAMGMSIDEKRSATTGKLPLRALLGQYLPDHIAQRPKHGFRVPLTHWFKGGFATTLRERLLDHTTPVSGLLPRASVETMLKEHIEGDAEHSIRLWSLLALQSWLEKVPNT